MIDDDFFPTRVQMRAIGMLLDVAHKNPETPAITERDLYSRVFEREMDIERQGWLVELRQLGLVAVRDFFSLINGDLKKQEPRVSITPAGSFYAVSRATMFMENARTPTDDFPIEVVETPFAIQSYYASVDQDLAPSADRLVSFDHNSATFQDAVQAIDAVAVALRDNEFGSLLPNLRDEKLEELRSIRELLEKPEVQSSKLQMMAWGVFGFLASEFASKPVGIAAEYAWQAILKLIGAS